MAKHTGSRASGAKARTKAGAPAVNAATEQRIVAFAEQIGRIAGALTARAEGLVDRKALNDQIASVRDGATALLGHLATGVEKGRASVLTAAKATKAAAARSQVPAARPASPPRGRGAVDAPGKKHRKPPPSDPRAAAADSKANKLRAAPPMITINRRRGRG
jgi:hypothetical protein